MEDEEIMKTGREKYWVELDLEEKLERMRKIVKNQGRVIYELKEKIRKLRKHTHVGNGLGEIAIPLDTQNEPRSDRPMRISPEEEYF